MRQDCDRAFVETQVAMLSHLAQVDSLPIPNVIPSVDANSIECVETEGTKRLAWMVSLLPGQTLASAAPTGLSLVREIGLLLGRLHIALRDFSHPGLDRMLKWDLTAADRFEPFVPQIEDPARAATVRQIFADFRGSHQSFLKSLPRQAIHNDLNDHNILVTIEGDGTSRVTGLIDFGDILYGPVLADVAIAGAYLVLNCDKPVERLATFLLGYQSVHPLTEAEVDAVWPLVLTRLAASVTNAAVIKQEKPDDPYVTVTEEAAWRLLDRLDEFDQAVIRLRLRQTRQQEAKARLGIVKAFLDQTKGQCPQVVGRDLKDAVPLDLTPGQATVPSNPFRMNAAEMARRVDEEIPPGGTGLGKYAEPRLIYTAPQFFRDTNKHGDRRTVHMGVDVFAPALTSVVAPLDGTIVFADWQAGDLEYGGLVILEHQIPDSDVRFQTLYGHLTRPSVADLVAGQSIRVGSKFAELADVDENGGWPPHLHLQIGIGMDGISNWPGVVFPEEVETWKLVFPNPAPLLNLEDDSACYSATSTEEILERRRNTTSPNLKTSYRDPITIVRGWKQYLFDQQGRCYLDAYNNVPHVGHCHPDVVRAVSRQVALLSTNTRYLNEDLATYAEALIARLPDELDTCFFVNSGSEANELAVRLARQFTEAQDVLVSEGGYHGITQTCIDISHYKFSGPGGEGQKEWVHVVDVPDTYRGKHRGADAGRAYADDLKLKLDDLQARGRRLACFISEPFPSVGGQIVPPPGYLARVYDHVRNSGALAIADEVQTGLGRLGRYPWGFSHQEAIPDIVVLGKPVGNGYPIGVVVTRRVIAEAFSTGMEFFSTFGGSTVSCAAGLAVLDVLDKEQLADNAERVGAQLLRGLERLKASHPVIGDVRGVGLFLGVDLTCRDHTPATEAAAYIVNRLKDYRILIGSDGLHDNVLKIRPPLCFSEEDAAALLRTLESVLGETPLKQLSEGRLAPRA
jgi:4-aminobutyrate aminotransferase-like enzyme/Ser/Thr protein kinase RdoA (MazF antagonist)